MTPEQVLAELAGELPPATLVLGRGAWPVVCQAARPDWLLRPELSADLVRELIGEVWMMPLSGGVRVAALRMEGASVQVQNMLLKILEEPPDSTRFVLTSDRGLLPTVMSRCQPLVLGNGSREPYEATPQDLDAIGAAVRLACASQTPQLSRTLRSWSPDLFRLLSAWAAEAASQRWLVFTPALAPDVRPETAMALVAQLGRRPLTRLSVLVALDEVFSRE